MPSFTDDGSGYYYHPSPLPTLSCCCCIPCCLGQHPYYHHGSGRPRGTASMGHCAESMGFSSSMAMWLAVVQLPVMLGLAMHYPTVKVDVFSTAVRTVPDLSTGNATYAVAGIDGDSAILVAGYEHGVGISGLYVLNAAAITFFAVLCMNMLERGVLSTAAAYAAAAADSSSLEAAIAVANGMASEEFVAQNIGMMVDPTFRMWNQAFTALLLITHGTFAATVCSPVSWDVLSTYMLLLYVSLVALVQPMDNYYSEKARSAMAEGDESVGPAAAGMMTSIASQSNMVKAVVCMLAFGYVLLHIPIDTGACKAQLTLALACLDSMLLYGHLWDRVPTLQVALNCRFMYACLAALLNLAAFVAWGPYMATPFVVQQQQQQQAAQNFGKK